MHRIRPLNPTNDETDIDNTPMLDVVFILLIFFIVTATFVKEQGISASRPDALPSTSPTDLTAILIEIGANNQIHVERRMTDVRRVRANIQRLHAERPNAPVTIKPHADAHTNTLVQVMDASRQAGVFDIALIN